LGEKWCNAKEERGGDKIAPGGLWNVGTPDRGSKRVPRHGKRAEVDWGLGRGREGGGSHSRAKTKQKNRKGKKEKRRGKSNSASQGSKK